MTTEDDLTQSVVRSAEERRLAELRARYPLPTRKNAQRPPLETAKAVGKDVAKGATEIPRAVAGGALDAIQETIDFAAGLDKKTADAIGFLPGLQITDPETGKLAIRPVNLADVDRENIGAKVPDLEDPESNTGKLIEGFSQFLTGFAGAGKVLKAGNLIQGAGAGSAVGRGFVQGAIADFAVFDPQEGRLSNLIEDVPGLSNPVTEFLSAKEDDGEIEGRIKNVLEGGGLGTLVEPFVQGLRVMRSARAAKKTLEDIDQIPAEVAAAQINAERIRADYDKALGDREGPAIRREKAARGGKDEIFVNFSRIEAEKDVKKLMGDMANQFGKDVNAARGGARVSVKAQKLAAEQIDAFDTLARRRQGEPLNASQTLAARELWAQSATKLKALATEAAASPTDGNLLAFRRMMAIHNTIQKEVIAARTETARALQIWSVPAGNSIDNARAIEDLLTQNGGVEANRQLAKSIAELGPKNAREFEKAVELSLNARTADAIAEVRRFMLLSGPQTHIVNALGNTMVLLQNMTEGVVASRLAAVLGRQADSVANGEVAALAQGNIAATRDMLRYVAKVARSAVFRDGPVNPDDFGIVRAGFDKVDAPRVRAVSAEQFGLGDSALGRFVDVTGAVVRSPQSLLGASDTVFKTINHRGELYRQAYRKVHNEVRLGRLAKEDIAARTHEILENPPDEILEAARFAALENTFTNPPEPGGALSGILRVRNKGRLGPIPLGHLLLPFVNTPANIMRFTFLRTPLAPMFKSFRADINAGGARAEVAMARMTTGSMIGLLAADMAMNGQITGGGPADTRQRDNLIRAGVQKYSIRLGDRWVAYNRLDPLGMTLGLGADMAEIFANTDWTDEAAEDPGEAFALAAGSIGQNVLSKSYLTGVAEFVEFLSDPDRYGEGFLTRLIGSSTVPALSATARRVDDPIAREAANVMDGIKNRVPGLSKDLPPRLDLWGQPIEYQSGFGKVYDAFSPIYTKVESDHPIDREVLRLGTGLSMPAKSLSVRGQNISLRNRPDIYARYVALAGNEMRINGAGARDTLNAIVSGRHPLSGQYERGTDGPEGGKSEMIKRVITAYRTAARAELVREFPELERMADEQRVELLR